MIVRIVRMTFREDSINDFLELFGEIKMHIASVDGCLVLELLSDIHHPNVFTTYSHWENEDKLNRYRDSELFGDVWPKTKKMFAEKPVAHSYRIQR
ncbi:MAG: antibiotic biosynthesis monooxygenase [Cyclobacteriaceae bacterium]